MNKWIWKNERSYQELAELLKPLAKYHVLNAAMSEAEAKRLLTAFMQEFRKLCPDKNYYIGNRESDSSYLINLIPIEEALRKHEYALACHELLTLDAYEPILQTRIRSNLIALYKSFLKERQ